MKNSPFEGGTAELLRRVERGDLHLGISAPPKPEDHGFGVRLLQPGRVLAVFPAKRRVGRTVDIVTFADERLLLFEGSAAPLGAQLRP